MRRIKLVLSLAAATVTMMALASPAFAGTDGSCIHVPISPVADVTMPPTSSALLLQLAVVVAVVAVVAAIVLAPKSTVRPPALSGTA